MLPQNEINFKVNERLQSPLGLWAVRIYVLAACGCRGDVRHIAMSPGVSDRMAHDVREHWVQPMAACAATTIAEDCSAPKLNA